MNRRFQQQDRAYKFPYHYIPHFDEKTGAAVSMRSLGWGLEYLCYLRHIVEIARDLSPQSVLDVGCGDGRFLGLLGPEVPRRVGVDLSERAVRFARAFQPDVEFQVVNATDLDETFDLVVAIEVLEHIAPDCVRDFLRSLSARVRPGGNLIISVPTPVSRLLAKHHRHYDLEALQEEIRSAGDDLRLVRVDYVYPQKRPILVRLVMHLCHNRWWNLDLFRLRKPLWNHIWKHRLTGPKKGRHLIALLCRAPGA